MIEVGTQGGRDGAADDTVDVIIPGIIVQEIFLQLNLCTTYRLSQ